MKLAPIFAEYLYTHRQLDLPGIGSFRVDTEIPIDLESIQSGKQVITEGIHFEANPSLRESPELVEFIAASTGKIRALAAADLDSSLESTRQFLNIGKPCLFDGIGTLTKLQNGQFEFQPGAPVIEKALPRAAREQHLAEEERPAAEGFKQIFYAAPARPNYRKVIFIFLLLAGVGLAIWGGYMVYKKTTSKETRLAVESPAETLPVADKQPAVSPSAQTADSVPASDTIVTSRPAAPVTPISNPAPAGSFKFVVETANKARGLARFDKLRGFGLPVQMETRDSLTFKLYFQLPALPADTSRILDSLKRLYTPAGHTAYIDKN